MKVIKFRPANDGHPFIVLDPQNEFSILSMIEDMRTSDPGTEFEVRVDEMDRSVFETLQEYQGW